MSGGTSVTGELKGPRLEYVVRELPGTIEVDISTFDEEEKALVKTPHRVPAGFMVFLPGGQTYRLSAKELKRRGYDKPPNIIGYESANDTSTAAGRFKLAINDGAKKAAYAELEKEVTQVALRRAGTLENLLGETYRAKEKAA